jgi:hypothetical protein
VPQAAYEIRARGALPASVVDQLDDVTCHVTGGETVLLTLDLDRQGLHALIGRLRDLGIELLELRKVTAGGAQHGRDTV